MEFESRSFPGKSGRPTPECWWSERDGLLIIATPWGSIETAKKVIEKARELLLTIQEDREVTTPFERLMHLSTTANDLRMTALLVNNYLFNSENKNELLSGVELAILVRKDNECAWLQSGQPNFFLARKDLGVTPLAVSMDLSFEMATQNTPLSPLPSRLLGINRELEYSVGSFRIQDDDQMIVLSHQNIPSGIMQPHVIHMSLDDVAAQLSQTTPDVPFWVGRVTL